MSRIDIKELLDFCSQQKDGNEYDSEYFKGSKFGWNMAMEKVRERLLLTKIVNPKENEFEQCKQEFEEFLASHFLSNERTTDAWGRTIYKHSHIEAMFVGWSGMWRIAKDKQNVSV